MSAGGAVPEGPGPARGNLRRETAARCGPRGRFISVNTLASGLAGPTVRIWGGGIGAGDGPDVAPGFPHLPVVLLDALPDGHCRHL
jgi:hypothetical protein